MITDRAEERAVDRGSGHSIGDLLKLMGSGAGGLILVALGKRPLRSGSLAERVPKYAPRTVYRYIDRLAELDLLDRREEPGVPSTVVYSLSGGSGRELFRLLDAYASAALPRGSNGRIDAEGWTAIELLGELWRSGWIGQLGLEPRTPTELAEATADLTFHQVNRRLRMLRARGFLKECASGGRGRRYRLSEQARQGMALVIAVGGWRQRHLGSEGVSGMTVPEMVTALRAALPLVEVPEHAGATIKLGVVGHANESGSTASETLCAKVGREAKLLPVADESAVDAWALGSVETWFSVALDGKRGRLRVGGQLPLVDASLTRLHEALWAPSPSSP